MSISRIEAVNFNSPDDFYTYEATNNENEMLAIIVHDSNNIKQPWIVLVNDKEVHRTHSTMRAQNYVKWHHKRNTLPKWEENISREPENEVIEEHDLHNLLFDHVKRSLVRFTIGVVICAASMLPALSHEIPLNGRLGNPVISKKPETPPKPSRIDATKKPKRGDGRREQFELPDTELNDVIDSE